MSRATKVLIAAGFVALLGFIIYSTMGLAKINCEVCMEFHGRTSCGSAAGTKKGRSGEECRRGCVLGCGCRPNRKYRLRKYAAKNDVLQIVFWE